MLVHTYPPDPRPATRFSFDSAGWPVSASAQAVRSTGVARSRRTCSMQARRLQPSLNAGRSFSPIALPTNAAATQTQADRLPEASAE